MLYILTGKTCSGKSTLANALVEARGLNRLRMCTTRPQRENESGNDYWFMCDEEYDEELAKGNIVAHEEYNTAFGVWKYGIRVQDILNVCKDGVAVIAMAIKAAERLRGELDMLDIESTIVYLWEAEEELLRRVTVRNGSWAENIRRYTADREDFSREVVLSVLRDDDFQLRSESDMQVLIEKFFNREAENEYT